MEFIETPTFTRLAVQWFDDDQLASLQSYLAVQPGAGALIPGGGGLRKLRWAAPGRGKRGGLRIIYYWRSDAGEIWLLLVYAKNESDDLSSSQLRRLREYIKELTS